MKRSIRAITKEYEIPSLDFVEKVFTDYKNAEEGDCVRRLVQEIRSKEYYLPELDLIMVNERDEIIGYCMFSRFHLEGKYENELLMLTPVAVKTELQRQHISKELIEYGLSMAKEMGYKAVIVEGNPNNYHARGFKTSADYGIIVSENIHLPDIGCMMVQELVPGALQHIHGVVDYGFYHTLSE